MNCWFVTAKLRPLCFNAWLLQSLHHPAASGSPHICTTQQPQACLMLASPSSLRLAPHLHHPAASGSPHVGTTQQPQARPTSALPSSLRLAPSAAPVLLQVCMQMHFAGSPPSVPTLAGSQQWRSADAPALLHHSTQRSQTQQAVEPGNTRSVTECSDTLSNTCPRGRTECAQLQALKVSYANAIG